eukprot:Ihof_evm2s343 gene=Ihof_evmTU2s343
MTSTVDELPKGFKEQAFSWATGHLPEWKDLQADQLEITIVRGGLTNLLYKLSVVGNDNLHIQTRHVLLRIYGTGTDIFFSRMMGEICFVLLSERKLGPMLYGVFPKGRLEQFFTGRTLGPLDMDISDISKNIATKAAILHNTSMPFDRHPVIFPNIKKWLDAARPIMDAYTPGRDHKMNNTSCDTTRPFTDEEIGYLTQLIEADLPNEAQWLEKEVLSGLSTPVGFCHNDLQAGNIMADPDHEIHLIDFEYANYNFVAYDIANHFCEWMFDYQSIKEWPYYSLNPSLFPDIKRQAQFLEEYIKESDRVKRVEHSEVTVERMREYLIDVNRLCLASHLLWTPWSIIQATCSTIDFPYLE